MTAVATGALDLTKALVEKADELYISETKFWIGFGILAAGIAASTTFLGWLGYKIWNGVWTRK